MRVWKFEQGVVVMSGVPMTLYGQGRGLEEGSGTFLFADVHVCRSGPYPVQLLYMRSSHQQEDSKRG